MDGRKAIKNINLYELFEITIDATVSEVKKAYRKKALKCHPDKNPDDPKAGELFHQLSLALEILADEKARQAYDRTLKAKEREKERVKHLDAKRRKFKEDLERREREAKERVTANNNGFNEAEDNLEKEIERLRREGSQTLLQEQEAIRQQIARERSGIFASIDKKEERLPKLKVKWTSSLHYDETKLKKLFSVGPGQEIIVVKNCALIEFKSSNVAQATYDKIKESEPSLKLIWVTPPQIGSSQAVKCNQESSIDAQHTSPAPFIVNISAGKNFEEFEAMMLRRLNDAAEKQKLTD